MHIDQKTFYQSNDLIRDYLEGKIPDLHGPLFSAENILKQATVREFSDQKRMVLVDSLKKQYENLELSPKVSSNIDLLLQSNVFTITTGHQLNIFTGPLFFFYKILQVINITEELNKNNQNQKFVPIFWMASEDHDFDEIAQFSIGDKKFKWKRDVQDAVGRISTEGLSEIFKEVKDCIGHDSHGALTVFEEYCKKGLLGKATLFLANELFGKYGLVIVDGDQKDLKRVFQNTLRKELVQSLAHLEIHDVISKFDKKGYKVQVNPREVNLFLLHDQKRGRIIKESEVYKIANSSLEFKEADILDLLEKQPEKFSPNVVMRPMYQETILPNVAYLGGAGEIAYWLELKSAFEKYGVPFPILVVRNSLLLVESKAEKKLNILNIELPHYLKDESVLIKEFIQTNSEELNMEQEEQLLSELQSILLDKSSAIDVSLKQAIEASLVRQKKELKRIENKFIKVLKQKKKHDIEAIQFVKNSFYPNGVFQERYENITPYLASFGLEFIDLLKGKIGAFDPKVELVFLNTNEDHT
ncbi:MAG: bacillithiol biosynthesis cysteine-adding enzyme BshC [Crocinitomicaceae bacterium]|nr:bacillithiol biosynthesis cysteine-adding enzyme BshC [Crocinitomicaceae bacterium]